MEWKGGRGRRRREGRRAWAEREVRRERGGVGDREGEGEKGERGEGEEGRNERYPSFSRAIRI